jgi:DNA-binding MarR family transcriptional regulator
MTRDIQLPTTTIAESTPEFDVSLDELVGYVLRRAQIKVFQHLAGELAEHDLRPAQFAALAILEREPGLAQADLARSLKIEPPQMVNMLNKLESRALAVRVRSPSDKRSYGVFLSRNGEKLLQELKGVAVRSDAESTKALTGDERDTLLHLLRKVVGNDDMSSLPSLADGEGL